MGVKLKSLLLSLFLLTIFAFFRGGVGVAIALGLCLHLHVNTSFFNEKLSSNVSKFMIIQVFLGPLIFLVLIPINATITDSFQILYLSEFPYTKSTLDKLFVGLLDSNSQYQQEWQDIEVKNIAASWLLTKLGALQVASIIGYIVFAFLLPLVFRPRLNSIRPSHNSLTSKNALALSSILFFIIAMVMVSLDEAFFGTRRTSVFTILLLPHAAFGLLLMLAFVNFGNHFYRTNNK